MLACIAALDDFQRQAASGHELFDPPDQFPGINVSKNHCKIETPAHREPPARGSPSHSRGCSRSFGAKQSRVRRFPFSTTPAPHV